VTSPPLTRPDPRPATRNRPGSAAKYRVTAQPLSAPAALLRGMLRDLAEEEPANESSLAASQAHMNESRHTDLAGPAALSDAAIIERSVAVPECFAEIFDRHAEGIYRYAARRLGQQAAADVMSEVFLAAFRNRRRYDTGRDDARPWLYGIAINVISQYQRTQRRHARVLAIVSDGPATDVVADEALDRVTATQLLPRIMRVLDKLSDSDRELVLLVAWAELSYQQAAQALGIPLGTVRSRLHRIRVKLRRAAGPNLLPPSENP
jgi:RNA polymerase sigma factor (sigma-70 family)